MIYYIDIIFKIIKPIKSLPPWSGARWNALFRLASKKAGVKPEEAFDILIPERWGQDPWLIDDTFTVRLWANIFNITKTKSLLDILLNADDIGNGQFILGQNLIIQEIIIYNKKYKKEILLENNNLIFFKNIIQPLKLIEISNEIDALSNIDEYWHIIFSSPLRLKRPKDAPGYGEYIELNYFKWSSAVEHLISRIRYNNDNFINNNNFKIISTHLEWKDILYNRDRKMKIGGLIGNIYISGRPNYKTSCQLVYGQYVGIGKNSRFGFGLYRIPELDKYRVLNLLPNTL
jgi:hypothetical protein